MGGFDDLMADVADRLNDANATAVERYARLAPQGPYSRSIGTPGKLHDSLVGEQPAPNRLTLRVEGAPHGDYLDDPRPEIRPRRSLFLSWVDPRTLERVFARKVTPTRRYAGWWTRDFRDAVDRAVREAFR